MKDQPPITYGEDISRNLIANFGKMELDAEGSSYTLGASHPNITTGTFEAATKKILAVNRGESMTDDRDSLQYQTIHDSSDFLRDKINQDQHGHMRQMLWKLTGSNGDLGKIPSGYMDKHVDQMLMRDGVGQIVEEINPLDTFDQNQRVTRLGSGGISSLDMVPKEARNVQPSYMNFIDPIRSPESLKIGVDLKLAAGVRRGKNGQMYTQFNKPDGSQAWVSARHAAKSNIAFPGQMELNKPFVQGIDTNGQMGFIPRETVDYVVPTGDHMFSTGSNAVPMKSGVKGMRLLMGAKFAVHAMPLVDREAPLVQGKDLDGMSVDRNLGNHLGAVRAAQGGKVISVHKDKMKVVYADGTKDDVSLYDNHPFSRKTYIRNAAEVKAGDTFEKGQTLASSNYTDAEGTAAVGQNVRVAYWNYDGKVFEDAFVMSESQAKRMASEHMYQNKIETDKNKTIGKAHYTSIYPGRFDKDQLANIGEDGMIKKGTVLNFGDPVSLAVKHRNAKSTSLGRSLRSDSALTWDHHFPGVVTDVVKGKKGYKLYTRANVPLKEGDKVSQRFGGKGIISTIIPDAEMPTDEKGRPVQIIMSSLGIGSRTNSAQMLEASLGKIARKTGKPYVLDGFTMDSEEDMDEFVKAELKKNNLTDRETLVDPITGRKIPKIFTGDIFLYKLQHMAEAKGKSRSTATYTAEDQPLKGGKSGAKHLGDMEIQALLGHGAKSVLKDIKIIKGQRNDEFWRDMKLGKTPRTPGTPMVYNKMKELIKAAGVNLHEGQAGDSIFGMTNKQAEELTGSRKIATANTYHAKDYSPVKGGLFDPSATDSGGKGERWGYIELPRPLPNPIMEDSIRRVLRIKQKEFPNMLAGEMEGPDMLERLAKINIGAEIRDSIEKIKHGPKSKRDDEVKRLSFLKAYEKSETHPKDFMMTRIPVLPPRYRPITSAGGMTMVNDVNYMYKSMMESVEDFNDTADLSTDVKSQAVKQMYANYKGLIGTAEPTNTKYKEKNIGGVLKQLFGKGSPKNSPIQRRIIGTNIDLTGLSVISPNPSLKMDQVGLPEELAWQLYEPFIIREMVKSGTPAMKAAKNLENKNKAAYKAMQKVITQRPVIINRAPSLHKYSVMAAKPVLTKGHTLQIPSAVVGPFGADFDGDTMSYSVPVSQDAVKEAYKKMLPSKNLLTMRDDSAHYSPSAEVLQGMWTATREPTDKPVQYFNTEEEAVKAYKAGELDINDPIQIGSGK